MEENRFVICFDARNKRFFEVGAVHQVEHRYRMNYYRFSLRLSFYDEDVSVLRFDDMRRLCFRKITNLMTTQNMWQDHHSFYVIEYEIRTVARASNGLIQQNSNESGDGDSETTDDSSYELDESASDDSAYSSLCDISDKSVDNFEDSLEAPDGTFEHDDSGTIQAS